MSSITISAEQYEAMLAAQRAIEGELKAVKLERDLLREQLRAHLRKLFAARSEVRSSDQRDLFLNEAEALAQGGAEPAEACSPVDPQTAAQAPTGAARARGGRKPLDASLPRAIVRHEIPEAERVCPHDGATLVEIGVESSEQLDIVPQQVRVIEHQRVKYACPCCDGAIRLTPAPARVIPKGLLSDGALAWVIGAKYQDGMPLYRLAGLLGRGVGADISRNTLAASVVRVGEAVQPLINLMRDQLLDCGLVYADETTLQVLKEPGRAAQTRSYLWAQIAGSGPPVRLFAYAAGRGLEQACTLYAGMAPGAVLMSDGYEVYNALAREQQLTHLGCWAHARRYFVEAEAALPRSARGSHQPASQVLEAIGALYAVEARTATLGPEARQAVREQDSRVVLERIHGLLLAHRHAVTPGSLLGKAFVYLEGQWHRLVRFVENGRWPIDNNLCENALRPFCVGRRNWLFADTVAGATASANLYSLIETCKACGIEPYAYMRELFARLPAARTAEDYAALLPWTLSAR